MTAATGIIVTPGNSITFGAGATTNWVTQAAATLALGAGFTFANTAVSGQTTPQMLVPATVLAQADSYYNAALGINICTVLELTNDFNTGYAAVEHAYERIRCYCGERKTRGFKVIVATMPPLEPSGGMFHDYDGENLYRLPVNTLIRTTWRSFADALCDIGADSVMGATGACTDLTYYQSDKIHPNDVGQTYLANGPNLFAAQIQALINAA